MPKKMCLSVKYLIAACMISLTVLFCGCTLAVSDAGMDGTSDRLIGAFVTDEYLDLYDMEGYLNDHVSSLKDGGSITVGSDSRYAGKLLATVDKSQGDDSSLWKVSFGGVKGEYLLVLTEEKDGESYTSTLCSDGILDVNMNLKSADNETESEISGTFCYTPDGIQKKDDSYYVNPVYQTENGEIYAMTGNGYAKQGVRVDEKTGKETPIMPDEGKGMAATLSAENTITKNGKSQTEKCKVTIQFEVMYQPVRTILYQMDEANQVLKQVAYNPSDVPDSITLEKDAAYVLVETRKEDPDGKMVKTRELVDCEESEYQKEDEAEEYQPIEVWYSSKNGMIGKKEIELTRNK